MTTPNAGPGTATGLARRFEAHERSRIRAAARHSRHVFPGDVGELLCRELIAYAEFGVRFSADALIPRLATQILTMRIHHDAEAIPRATPTASRHFCGGSLSSRT
jgi:hypothetical protein